MKNLLIGVLLFALLLSLSLHLRGQDEEPAVPQRMVLHSLYVELKDDSEAERGKFITESLKHLSGQPGARHYWAGERAVDINRAREFDVVHHVVFESMDAYRRWWDGPERQRFLDETKANRRKAVPRNAYVRAATDE